MAHHGSVYKRLSSAQQLGYEQEAAGYRVSRHEQSQQEKDDMVSQIRAAKEKVREKEDKRQPLSLSACQLTTEAMQRLHDFWDCNEDKVSAALRQFTKRLEAPTPVDATKYQGVAHDESSWMMNPSAERPDWLSTVVSHRKEFRGKIWELQVGKALQYHQLMFSVKGPYQIYFSSLDIHKGALAMPEELRAKGDPPSPGRLRGGGRACSSTAGLRPPLPQPFV